MLGLRTIVASFLFGVQIFAETARGWPPAVRLQTPARFDQESGSAPQRSGGGSAPESRLDEEMLVEPDSETGWRRLSFTPELVIGLTSVFR